MSIEPIAESFFNMAKATNCCELWCHERGHAGFSIMVTIMGAEHYSTWHAISDVYHYFERHFGEEAWAQALGNEVNKYFERVNADYYASDHYKQQEQLKARLAQR